MHKPRFKDLRADVRLMLLSIGFNNRVNAAIA